MSLTWTHRLVYKSQLDHPLLNGTVLSCGWDRTRGCSRVEGQKGTPYRSDPLVRRRKDSQGSQCAVRKGLCRAGSFPGGWNRKGDTASFQLASSFSLEHPACDPNTPRSLPTNPASIADGRKKTRLYFATMTGDHLAVLPLSLCLPAGVRSGW